VFAGTLAVAIFLALCFVSIGRRLDREKSLYATGLVIAALVYPMLAITKGDRERLWLELVGLVLFSLTAFLGFKLSSRWLALGWVGNGMWEVLLPSVPWWYVHGCTAFDFFLAGYILGRVPAALSTQGVK